MKVLFLDESGDHNLSTIDPHYPMFVLGGVIMDKDYADGPLVEALNEFKREIFGHTGIVLHTSDIARNTRYIQANVIEDRIFALNLRAKKDNIAGLQLADLVVSPIGRHVLGKPHKEDWRIIQQKFRRSSQGEVEGYGLVTLPR